MKIKNKNIIWEWKIEIKSIRINITFTQDLYLLDTNYNTSRLLLYANFKSYLKNI